MGHSLKFEINSLSMAIVYNRFSYHASIIVNNQTSTIEIKKFSGTCVLQGVPLQNQNRNRMEIRTVPRIIALFIFSFDV